MGIEIVSAYQCVCGRCGKGYRTDELEAAGVPLVPMVWKEKENLLDWLHQEEYDENWKQIEEDWYCGDCYEWNEQETELVPKSAEK